ncbi:MAG: hypothetical protein KAJ86_07705 [Alphaproteobacteria bacterium]|nr:hypothetical protein [Alphaproteobacteria bacterium]
MTKELLNNKLEKFYFNVNVFEKDHVENEIIKEELPPPPVFNENDIANAKKKAFENGKMHGVEETKKTRSEIVAKALESISRDTDSLFQKETQRGKLYEKETLELTLNIFKKLFPVYQKHYGFEELKEAITSILKKQQNQKEIIIYVEPDASKGTEKLLSELSLRRSDVIFQVHGDENLSNGECRMSWKDGGANIDPEALTHKIQATIEQVLAANDTKGHDDNQNKDSGDTDQNAINEMMENPDE